MHYRFILYIVSLILASSFKQPDTTTIQEIYKEGRSLLRIQEYDSALLQIQIGLELSRNINNEYLEGYGLYNLAIYYEGTNNLAKALDTLSKSHAIFIKLHKQKEIANCYNSYSRIYQMLGNYSQALFYGLEALKIRETGHNQEDIAVSLTIVGNVYLLTGNFDDALSSFVRALKIDSLNNDKLGVSISLINIGVAYQKKNDFDKALMYYHRALSLVKELNNKADEKLLLNNIGFTLRQQGNLDSSLYYLTTALAIAEEYNYSSAHLRNDIVETYLSLNLIEEAKKAALLAIEQAKEENNLNQYSHAWLFLSTVYYRSGEYKNAFNALQTHAELKDSIFDSEKNKQVEELKILYESEKQAGVIESLNIENKAAEFRRNTYLVSGILISIILLLLYNSQRLKALKNKALYEKIREVDLMKTNFYANVSHEIRTPLTLILGPIQTLKQTAGSSYELRMLNTMEHNSLRLLNQIDELLYLSKSESNKLNIILSRIDIIQLIRSIAMNFSSIYETRHINMRIETSLYSLVVV